MCEIVDNYAKEVAKAAVKKAVNEENKSMAKKLFEKGVDFDVVCSSVTNISIEELSEIYSEVVKKQEY